MMNKINEIARGKNLETNIPAYAEYMMNVYNKSANVQFTMNYYTYYEVIAEYAGNNKKEIEDILLRLNALVDKCVINTVSEDIEASVKEIAGLRKNVMDTMKVLTAYVDIFGRYEYVMNRIEYRFRDEKLPCDYSDEEMAKNVMRYIISNEDNAVINYKITEMIGQLPVRMVKNKFFEYVNEGINVYSEADKKSFDDFVYMIRTNALLDRDERFDSVLPEFRNILKSFENANFSKLEENEYKDLFDKLTYVIDSTNEMVDIYMMVSELINQVYVMILATPYIENDDEINICKKIDDNIFDLFAKGEYVTIDEETEELLVKLEGVPENIGMECAANEYALDVIRESHMDSVDELNCSGEYEALFMCQKLMSGSLFIDLDGENNDTALEEAYFVSQRDKIISDIKESFEGRDKMLNRAVMASVLSTLPVFFNNMNEVKDYVIAAFDSCRDEAEKLGSIEIINTIIEAD
ncbi:MAG: hypothetical protein IJC76_00335 [Lachnospiraceae bacterium]|nr:hypothetical protein [Lachnospiraceae bacterium]